MVDGSATEVGADHRSSKGRAAIRARRRSEAANIPAVRTGPFLRTTCADCLDGCRSNEPGNDGAADRLGNRQGPAGFGYQFDGGNRVPISGAAAFQHVIARRLCQSGAPSGGGWYLRGDELFGGATHARNRDSHRSRRAEKRRTQNDSRGGIATGLDRPCHWLGWGSYPHAANVESVVWGERERSDHIYHHLGHSRQRGGARQLRACASRDASRSDVRIALPITRPWASTCSGQLYAAGLRRDPIWDPIRKDPRFGKAIITLAGKASN